MDIVENGKKVARFVKIEHTLFSLPTIFAGMFLASPRLPSLRLVVLVLAAAVGARTVAMTLNRIIDRRIDARNPRTSSRELPSGAMTLTQAKIVLVCSLFLYLGSAALISPLCLKLSPIPLVVFGVYPYMKRFTSLAHFGVGAGLAMAPLGGWIAVTNSLENILPAALVALFVFFWSTGFDIIYSTLDENFDREEQLYSLVARYGKKRALQISALLHALAFIPLLILFFVQIRGITAFVFLLISGYLLYLEHKKAEDVELAFFKINAVTGFVVLAMVLVGVYLP